MTNKVMQEIAKSNRRKLYDTIKNHVYYMRFFERLSLALRIIVKRVK